MLSLIVFVITLITLLNNANLTDCFTSTLSKENELMISNHSSTRICAADGDIHDQQLLCIDVRRP